MLPDAGGDEAKNVCTIRRGSTNSLWLRRSGAVLVAGQPVVYTDANDVVTNLGLAPHGRKEGLTGREAVVDRAEVEVQILDLSGPVAEQPGFDAAAGDPTTLGLLERRD